jgi:DNA-binding transcriptional MerR regulator
MTQNLTIGSVAELAGIKIATIRYYEEIGLLPQAPRTVSNRRSYTAEDVRRLKFVRHARELGFDINAIRQLLALARQPEEPCADADEIARSHLREVDAKIVRLSALRKELQTMIGQGAHGLIRECRVIEVLAGEDA